MSEAVSRLLSRPPSSTVTVIVEEPKLSTNGSKVSVPDSFPLSYTIVGSGIRSGLLLAALTRIGWIAPSPEFIPLSAILCADEFPSSVMSGGIFNSGG